MLKEGDWILITFGEKRYLRKLDPKDSLNVKREVLRFSEVIGKPEGFRIGKFEVFKPSLEDFILYGFKRETQIVYPKDSFYIAFKLGAGPDRRVLEFGTGSGAMTAVFSWIGCEVYSFEVREKFYSTAKKNLERFGLDRKVRMVNEDFKNAELQSSSFDCAFIDVKDPLPYLEKVMDVLKDGASVCFLLPTTNQVSALLKGMDEYFGSPEVIEILMRKFNVNPERLRPADLMIGHTAYLVFCRKVRSSYP